LTPDAEGVAPAAPGEAATPQRPIPDPIPPEPDPRPPEPDPPLPDPELPRWPTVRAWAEMDAGPLLRDPWVTLQPRIWLPLALLAAVGLGSALLVGGGARSPTRAAVAQAPAQARADHALTLLDWWNQALVKDVLLADGRARALRRGELRAAARLWRPLRADLMRVRRLWADAAGDPLLGGHPSPEGDALAAARDAWVQWADALLARPAVAAPRIAALEAAAVRRSQRAYAVIDASLLRAVSG
jgi:hypothetical protein